MITISTIVITEGREEHLMKCLSSLLQLPKDSELILLVNGHELEQEIKNFITENFSSSQVIEQEARLSPGEAKNLCLSKTQKEWIFFISPRASLEEGYWEKVQSFLKQKEIDVLGGPDTAPTDMGYLAQAHATAVSSPFCSGLTFSRHYSQGKKMQFATEENLTGSNLWIRKKLFEHVSFPTKYQKGEESLVLAKLSDMGFGLFYHPKLRVVLYRNSDFSSILKESFSGGYYRSLMMKEKVDFSWSYYLPTLFILFHLTVFIDPYSFLELARIYLLLIACLSIGIAQRQKRLSTAPLVFVLHYLIVFAYGFGFMSARIYNKTKKASN